MQMINCKSCAKPFARPVQRGRPAVRCAECRAKDNTTLEQKELPEEVGSIPPETTEEVPVKQMKAEDNYPYLYRLMVGNMGLAHAGDDEKTAFTQFDSYVRKSNLGYGQIGFEAVQLWKLNRDINSYELAKEFLPSREF